MNSWFVTRVKTGQERRAVENLKAQGYTVFYPRIKTRSLSAKSADEKPLFPGYVFIEEVLGQSISAVRSTYGVINIVRFGQRLATVPNSLIKTFVEAEKALDVVNEIERGDPVRFHEGPFAGLNAVYDQPNGELRSYVLLELLGKVQKLLVDNRSIGAA